MGFSQTLSLGLLIWFGVAATVEGDSVESVDGTKITGTVREVREDRVAFAPSGKPDALEQLEFVNLLRVTIDPFIDRRQLATLVIDNDGAEVGRTRSNRVKLRAGLHRFVLPYWHQEGNAMLRIQFSGPKQSLRVVPASMLVHPANGASETRSRGLDAEGFRLPETVTATAPGLVYSVHMPAEGCDQATIRNFIRSKAMASPETPVMDRIGPKPITERSGMVISGYLKIEQDGEYTILLTSDGGSQLYFGPTPRPFRAHGIHREHHPWSLQFRSGQTVAGRLVSWDSATVGLEIELVEGAVQLRVPTEFILALHGNHIPDGGKGAGDRPRFTSSPAADLDTVWAITNADKTQPVPGRVLGIEGDSLLFRFQEDDRRIKLDKVAGIVLAANRPRPPQVTAYHHTLSLVSDSAIPGSWKSLKENDATFETLWGQSLSLSIDDIIELSVRNGRLVSLVDLEPAAVEQVPFFDRVVPYRVNQSLSGGPLRMRDQTYEQGLSVQARTVLHYDLAARFQKFLGVVGFDHPAGDIGRAAVRVLGDDRVLFENPDFSGTDAPRKLDLDVTGVRRLSLEVDFGENQDVGDRIIWGNPRLLRDRVEL